MYKSLIRPILEKLDHEKTKTNIINSLHLLESNPIGLSLLTFLADKQQRYYHPKLETNVAGIAFDNPLLLAAGWDKEGKSVKAMYRLGFGGIEIGTVTAYPQPGNPRPRLHLLDSGVALNYFGFNGPGMEQVAQNLRRYRNSGIPIGINISKNKYVTATGAAPLYAVVLRRLYDLGDYFVINASSPNTVGLKILQGKKFLDEIAKEMLEMMDDIGKRKPVFIKIAPDISFENLNGVIEVVGNNKLAGIIAVNTFPHANSLAKYGQTWEDRQGGLSGLDSHYRNIGTRYLSYIHNQTNGKVTTIGVGGVYDTQTALEKIAAGATLVQVFTGLFSEGPSLPGKINRGIVQYMEKEGIKDLSEIRGIDAKTIWENKDNYSFNINENKSNLSYLKEEYLKAVFQKDVLDTLLIREKPFKLKHGELGRDWSRIYLNHRIPLFTNKDYLKLFAKIFDGLIREKIANNKSGYGLISIGTTASPELARAIQQFSDSKIDKLTLLPKLLMQEEKGTQTAIYGNLNEDKEWIMIDDVFTSGKTFKREMQNLEHYKKMPKKLSVVSLVARNKEIVDLFSRQNNTVSIPFITMDEILQYHWSNFSTREKNIIKKERTFLQ